MRNEVCLEHLVECDLKSIETIPVSELGKRVWKKDFRVARIECGLEISKLCFAVDNVLRQYQPALKDRYDNYFSLGLQYDDESNPIYDAVQTTVFYAADGRVIASRENPTLFHKINERQNTR